MTVKQYIKHLAIITKKTCDKYGLPTTIDLEKYKDEEYKID